MNLRIFMLSAILSFILILSACQKPTPSDSSKTDRVQENVSVDEFREIRESDEEWLVYGLHAFESKKEIKDLKNFFSDASSVSHLTLYDHIFTYDKETHVPIAEALFRFIYENYGADALLDIDKRCEYKTAFLKSLGSPVEYYQPKEIETLLATMDFSSNDTYKYVITFDNVSYYFKDLSVGSPSQYNGFLYHNTTGLYKMIEYIKSNGLEESFDTDRQFNYYMTFDVGKNSFTLFQSGDMYVNDSSTALHEAVHAMGIGMIPDNQNIWLSEGLSSYFGMVLGFNDQTAASYIQLMTMAKNGLFDERAENGDTQAATYIKLYDDYTQKGGKVESVDSFDIRLFFSCGARTELDTGYFETIAESYKRSQNKDIKSQGDDLSYNQATSLVTYLVDKYGIQKVLSAYDSQDINSVFGKSYEDLKSDWLIYLNN